MENYSQLKEEIRQISKDARNTITQLSDINEIKTTSIEKWVNTCDIVEKQINEDIIRVAVVGAIKSGKSTVANTLIGGDHLKRGAGVVTSIVTRIRSGQILRAKIHLKSWETINNEITQATVLFPGTGFQPQGNAFDIRNAHDREGIQRELALLDKKLFLSADTRNENTVLLNAYLTGYEKISSLNMSEDNVILYSGNEFFEHSLFTGNDTYATFVEDIELEINSGKIDSHIELADCQGSDSPNPMHIAQVQDYLLKTHLIIYVVSSRTGLRQADIKFLSMIKEMGIIDNIVFVLNVDMNEHESLSSLKALIEKVIDDISLIKPSPDFYAFSALNNLFHVENIALSEKEQKMADFWSQDHEFFSFLNSQTDSFKDTFNNFITQKRYSLLLENHIERLNILGNNLDHFISLNMEILKNDTITTGVINDSIKIHQKKMNQTRKLIKNTFDGSVQKLKKELKSDIDSFFDEKYGNLVTSVVKYIENYQFEYDKYHDSFTEDGFSNTLYIVFQEFRQSLNAYMTEKTHPQIISYLKGSEEKIAEFLQEISKPFDLMVKDAMNEYRISMEKLGLSVDFQAFEYTPKNVDLIKEESNITLPKSISITSYTKLIKTDAIMRFGFYSVINYIKRIFNKKNATSDASKALKDSIKRIKKETTRSVLFYFLDYKENLKFKYVFKIIDSMVEDLYSSLNDRFHNYLDDLTEASNAISEKTINKDQFVGHLNEIQENIRGMNLNIQKIRESIGGALQ